VRTYCWKQLDCELCKEKFPFKFNHKGMEIELLEYELPEGFSYIILESVTTQSIKIIHVIC